MAAMSVYGSAGVFDIMMPAEQHPLVGHAESDVLVSYPKFDCIGKQMVMTKVATITHRFRPASND